MKEIELTKGKKALVDDEDFEKLNKYKWCTTKSGSGNVFYAVKAIRKFDGKYKLVKMHTMLMDTPENYQVDHINGNGLDNRKENLRLCTSAENHFNLINVRRDSKLKIKGLYWCKDRKKFQVKIGFRGKAIHLGRFFCVKKAMEIYREAEKKYFGDFARRIYG